jgi:hypothetical protein
VDTSLHYFVEDTWCIADSSQMDRSVPFNLIVSTASNMLLDQVEYRSLSDHKSWILDICLDYFGSYNPFAFKIENLQLSSISHCIRAAFDGVKLDKLAKAEQLTATRILQEGLALVLQHPEWFHCEVNGSKLSSLLSLYETSEVGEQLLGDLIDAVRNITSDVLELALQMLPCATLPHSPGTPCESLHLLKVRHAQLHRRLPSIH